MAIEVSKKLTADTKESAYPANRDKEKRRCREINFDPNEDDE